MKPSQFDKLRNFLDRLDKAKIHYQLMHSRDEAISVLAYAPGEYWEIDFLADGEIDVERYRSNGHLDDESVLEELFALWSEPETPTGAAENHDDATARK